MGLLAFSPKVEAPTSQTVLERLQAKIHLLEELPRHCTRTVSVCNHINNALPYRGLPLGCVHEIKGARLAHSIAFASLLSARIPRNGAILYVAPDRSFYPLGLIPFGLKLEQWVHVFTRRPKDLVWTVLEALRCPQVSAVLAVIKNADLTLCRRFQLAAENSGTTGFLLGAKDSAPVASAITRWEVMPVKIPHGAKFDESVWDLRLTYCRGGRPGEWITSWRDGELEGIGLPETKFRPAQKTIASSGKALAG